MTPEEKKFVEKKKDSIVWSWATIQKILSIIERQEKELEEYKKMIKEISIETP